MDGEDPKGAPDDGEPKVETEVEGKEAEQMINSENAAVEVEDNQDG